MNIQSVAIFNSILQKQYRMAKIAASITLKSTLYYLYTGEATCMTFKQPSMRNLLP